MTTNETIEVRKPAAPERLLDTFTPPDPEKLRALVSGASQLSIAATWGAPGDWRGKWTSA
jgi:hypothetical protein